MDNFKITIYIGQLLKTQDFASALDVQDFIQETEGFRPPLDEIRPILQILELSGWLVKAKDDLYSKSLLLSAPKENFNPDSLAKSMPIWSPNL